MTTDATACSGGVVRQDMAAQAPARITGSPHSGAELVALSERFYDHVFIGAVSFVGISTFTALAFLPLRTSAKHGRPPLQAVIAAVAVLVLAGVVILRAGNTYRLLRSRTQLELVPVLIAALLLSVASPLRNELWWSACAILMSLALLVSLRRALVYCLIVLLANLTAHVVSGDIAHTPALGIVGLWIGLPFWTAMAAIVPDRMVCHILRLNIVRHVPPAAAVRVAVLQTPPPQAVRPSDDASAHPSHPPTMPEDAAPPTRTASTSRLTGRQLQVVALLADGYRYRHIADCLSISPGQVHRHVTNAIARLDVKNANELVTTAVAEGLVRGAEAGHAKATSG